jgi:phospholipase C
MGASDIEHVIVLMLENRSFDSMLGKLYPAGPAFDGLTGNESNPFRRSDGIVALPVWSSNAMDPIAATTPTPDPGELFADMNEQLFGPNDTRNAARPAMKGFVTNYMNQPATDDPRDPMAVMHYFTPDQVPVLSKLAKEFGVSDRWFASAPCQTWPNRFFAHTGTAQGYVDNGQFPIPFPGPSIFSQLSGAGKSWRVYFHDVPQSVMLQSVWPEAPLRYRFFSQFLADAGDGALPNYSFIEPRYFPDLSLGVPNDQHPPHDVSVGERLIAQVYNAVRGSPLWKKSLLIITYDEHGGCFDHAPPPCAVSPDGKGPAGFVFDRYGVRVPAVIISPYMEKGSIVRPKPPAPGFAAPPYPFDHTSIIATLRTLFALGAPLTNRDAAAPDLLGFLTLLDPTNDGPLTIDGGSATVDQDAVRAAAGSAPNHHQKALSAMAQQLPPDPGTGTAVANPPTVFDTALEAGLHAADRIRTLLGL